MPYLGTSPSSGLGNVDLNGQRLVLDVDADTHIEATTDDTIDIAVAGANDFQFTANTFTAVSGSTIAAQALTATSVTSTGAISATTLTGSGVLSIDDATDSTSGTSGSIHTDGGVGIAKDLVVAGDILAADGSAAAPSISFSGDTNDGLYSSGAGEVSMALEGAQRFVFANGNFFHHDNANANAQNGNTFNQLAADNEILALKSSDVAHGMTGLTETDTYFFIQKYNATNAGVDIRAYSEATNCMRILATATGENTGDTTGSSGSMLFTSTIKSGTSNTAHGATGNMMSWHNSGTTAMILKGNGVLHLTNTTLVALDEEDDAMLIRQLDLVGSKDKSDTAGIIETQWDNFIEKNDSKLKEIGVLSSENDFIALQPWVKLANGAIWQQRAMFETMKQVAEEMLPGFSNKLNERLEAQNLPALPA